MDIIGYFKNLRFDNSHHLGLGDIRLTLAQQAEIEEAMNQLYAVYLAADDYVVDYHNSCETLFDLEQSLAAVKEQP